MAKIATIGILLIIVCLIFIALIVFVVYSSIYKILNFYFKKSRFMNFYSFVRFLIIFATSSFSSVFL